MNWKVWTAIVLLFLFIMPKAIAQRNAVDEISSLLDMAFSGNKVDTVIFSAASDSAFRSTIKQKEIAALIRVAEEKIPHQHEDLQNYYLYRLMQALIRQQHYSEAIALGKQIIASTEGKASPEAYLIKQLSLQGLRYPFRNSLQLQDGFTYYNGKLKYYAEQRDAESRSSCHMALSTLYYTSGLFDQAVYHLKNAHYYFVDTPDEESFISYSGSKIEMKRSWYFLLADYLQRQNEYQASYYLLDSIKVDVDESIYKYRILIDCFIGLNKLDSVPAYIVKAFGITDGAMQHKAALYQSIAIYYLKKDSIDKARKNLYQCLDMIRLYNLPAFSSGGVLSPHYYLALIKQKEKQYDSAIALVQSDITFLLNLRIEKLRDYRLLAELYQQKGDYKSMAMVNETFIELQDSVSSDQRKFQSFSFETEQQLNSQEFDILRLSNENKISTLVRNFLIGIALLVVIIAALIYYRYKNKQKDNLILQNTLTELQATQSQLIQSEKMASLGELTAGIAHEIQNPLNFVNNFSEINDELIIELVDELKSGNADEAIAIASDIKNNAQKINEHGKRAGAIVKGMLEHSRKSDGQKEATDINQLADECLRLAYHGMRAKDKTFNAEFKTQFDEDLPMVDVVSSDIGRVLLNLINNAFYAVNEKAKTELEDYQPQVVVSTTMANNHIVVKVSDNGGGIPDDIKDKIFQPFFTTKPTGSGTGLGLSLSYDIVKAHGGEISVVSNECKGTEFILQL